MSINVLERTREIGRAAGARREDGGGPPHRHRGGPADQPGQRGDRPAGLGAARNLALQPAGPPVLYHPLPFLFSWPGAAGWLGVVAVIAVLASLAPAQSAVLPHDHPGDLSPSTGSGDGRRGAPSAEGRMLLTPGTGRRRSEPVAGRPRGRRRGRAKPGDRSPALGGAESGEFGLAGENRLIEVEFGLEQGRPILRPTWRMPLVLKESRDVRRASRAAAPGQGA